MSGALLAKHGENLRRVAILLFVFAVLVFPLFDAGVSTDASEMFSGGGGGVSGGGGRGVRSSGGSGGSGASCGGGGGGAPGGAAPLSKMGFSGLVMDDGHVNRAVSIEWTGRATEVIQYTDSVAATVYRHDFPGSTLWLDFWNRVQNRKWEHETLWILEYFLSPARHENAVYVDFGSWIGPTVLFAGQFASRVYSLEPDPLSFSTLNANVNLNPVVAARTNLYHECIAPKTGELEFSGSGESNTRMSGTLDTKFLKAGTRWMVNCRTLPQFLKDERVDMANLRLIKMDTEGTELWLLPALRPWLEGLGKGNKPAIWLSVHSPFWKDQDKPEHPGKVQAAWDVLGLFEYVYDQDLKRIYPAKMKADLCPDFCTFLLSDERAWCAHGRGASRQHARTHPLTQRVPLHTQHTHTAQHMRAKTMKNISRLSESVEGARRKTTITHVRRVDFFAIPAFYRAPPPPSPDTCAPGATSTQDAAAAAAAASSAEPGAVSAHTRIRGSSAAPLTRRPSGSAASAFTSPACPSSDATHARAPTSHTRTVLS
jgi:FkbM family methyltransferase